MGKAIGRGFQGILGLTASAITPHVDTVPEPASAVLLLAGGAGPASLPRPR